MKKNIFPREIWDCSFDNKDNTLMQLNHPCLVLNDYKTLSKQDLIQVVPITSNTDRLLRSHVVLEGYGLKNKSKAIFEQIQTIHRSQLNFKIGKVDDIDKNKEIDAIIKKTILVDSESKLNLDNVLITFNKKMEEQKEVALLNDVIKSIRINYFNKNYDLTICFAEQLLKDCKSSNLDRRFKNDFTWYANYTKSLVAYAEDKIEESFNFVEIALKYINPIDDKHNYATTIWHLANLHEEVNNLEEAKIIFEKLSKYYKVNNMHKERMVAVFNIAFVKRDFKIMHSIISGIKRHEDKNWYYYTDKNIIIENLEEEVERLKKRLKIK